MSKLFSELVTQHAVACPGQFRVWLQRVYYTGNAHGRELIASLPNTMMAADGCRLLAGAVEAGWVSKAKLEPNANEIVLGAGGLSGRRILELERRGMRPPWADGSYAPHSWFNYGTGPNYAEGKFWCI